MISIFTPVHLTSSEFLIEAYKSLSEQTFTDWEWIIVLNNGGKVESNEIKQDKKVNIIQAKGKLNTSKNIGWLKNYSISQCKGNIVVELDADDMLTPVALERINEAFMDESISFVYSNTVEFYNKTWKTKPYGEYYGWKSREFIYKGHSLLETISWAPSAQMMRRIEWAPNHVRAWRVEDYQKVGGHDISLPTGDDHELLCKLYIEFGASGMKHLDEPLYLYRLHDTNTCVVDNKSVQDQTLKNYLNYSRRLAIKWAEDSKLLKIDLGGRFNNWDNFTTVDLLEADLIFDLNENWLLKDNSVGVLRASNIFEHLKDPVHAMNEAFRVLAPGGFLFLEVPSTDGRGAYQDPTHVSFWNQNSIWYYTDKNYSKYISPQYKGRFQNARTVTYFPDEYSKTHNISYVQADLIALKGEYSDRPVGEVLI